MADPEAYYISIDSYISANADKVVAIGECGLDYDRLKFCDAATQRTYFEKQLDLVATHKLPLFLHCRNAFDDFFAIVQRNAHKIREKGGVVHSFDGTLDQAKAFIELGFYIGINGCSLKTQEQLDTVAQLPLDRILLETDCPWCGIRPSHAGYKLVKTKFETVKRKDKWTETAMVDGRNEPAQIRQVLDVLVVILNKDEEQLAEQFYENTCALFFAKENGI